MDEWSNLHGWNFITKQRSLVKYCTKNLIHWWKFI
jgi:hypothetical protein